jgi:hypothetical protein
LENGNISEETIQKQERILSRMLEGSQSLNKRDFDKKYEAEKARAQGNKRTSPPLLTPDSAGKIDFPAPIDYSSYPKEFRDLIKKYLQNLNR